MDGDRTDIDQLLTVAKKFNAMTIIDEAHATGVLGENGMGLACNTEVDVIMGTFGKACGSFGAYLAVSKLLKQYLINCCSGFIYTTALPPAVIGAIDAALDLIPTMTEERAFLHKMSDYLRSSIQKIGYDTGGSTTQIIPVIIGKDEDAVSMSEWLNTCGFFAAPIRYPTVEKGQARIRLTLSAVHTKEQIDGLIDAISGWEKE